VSSDLTANVDTVPRGVPSFTAIGGTSAHRVFGAILKFPALSSGGANSTASASDGGDTVIVGLDVPPRANGRAGEVVCASATEVSVNKMAASWTRMNRHMKISSQGVDEFLE
jgi:hypothetical protein